MKVDETIAVVSGATPSSPNWDLSVVTETVYGTGQSFTLAATVKNANAAGRSEVSSLIFYHSTDTTITTADTPIGDAVSVSALTGGSTATHSLALTSPTIFGTYYYGACVTVAGDINTGNDCSAAATWSKTGFDLSVAASTDKASVLTDEQFTFTAAVTNDPSATRRLSLVTVRYYRSTDSTIDSSDTQLDWSHVTGLGAGQTVTDFISVTAPSTPGTYYYGVCHEGNGDSNPSNDCSAGVEVVVSSPPPVKFDLSVSAHTFDTEPNVGDRITISAFVDNSDYALESSPSTTVIFYRSSDATIDSSDTLIGTSSLSAIPPGGSNLFPSIAVTVSATGIYHYGACVTATGDEDTSNDCSVGVPVTVSITGFDLSTAATVTKTAVTFSEEFQVAAVVTNDAFATTSSRAATLRYYRSPDATIDSSDIELGSDTVSALSAGQSAAGVVTAIAPTSAGTYYYGACAVASGDGDTSNDCSPAVSVVVTE